MSISETNGERKYTKFKRHVNESSERIDATTINNIQSAVTEKQEEINDIKDHAFKERVYTIFENNLFTNAMFLDGLESTRYLDITKTENIVIDNKKSMATLENKNLVGHFTTENIHSVHGVDVEMNDFFLIANEFKPTGSKIEYTVILANGERFAIHPNKLKTPLHFNENITRGFRLQVTLTPNGFGEAPYLNGYAILYWDGQVELNLGITNPDLKRFPRNRNRL